MSSSKIKVLVPQEIEQDFFGLDGFNVVDSDTKKDKIQDFQMNIADLVNADSIQTTVHAAIWIVGLLSNVNGAVNLFEKIRNFFQKNPNSDKKIQIQTPTKLITIKADSSLEDYQKLQDLLERMASQQ